MRKLIAMALATSLLAACGSDADTTAEAPAYSATQYNAAINDIARPPEDRERDAARKPGELLAFAQIDRGDVVGDFIMGGGYVTRLLAMAVGANGKVYAFQPDEFVAFRAEYADEQAAAVAPYADDQGNPVRVYPLNGSISAPPFPEPLDAIITVMNLHDLYLSDFPEDTASTTLAALYDALKPGGTLVVVDHRAAEGSGAEAANTVHRMDYARAIADLEAAGFVLEEETDLYAQPDDPLTDNVFEDSIRGQTDQFALRLRKPA